MPRAQARVGPPDASPDAMSRDKKRPVALIVGAWVALGLAVEGFAGVAAHAHARALGPSPPSQTPYPEPSPPPPPVFEGGSPVDAAPYDSGIPFDAGR